MDTRSMVTIKLVVYEEHEFSESCHAHVAHLLVGWLVGWGSKKIIK